jgi:hypothetical protein
MQQEYEANSKQACKPLRASESIRTEENWLYQSNEFSKDARIIDEWINVEEE